MAHLHSFNLWNERTRSYDCECGARLYEEVLEAHAPYGSDIYRQRIRALKELLYEVWLRWNDCCAPVDLRRRVLNELVCVMPDHQRQQALKDLEAAHGSKNP